MMSVHIPSLAKFQPGEFAMHQPMISYHGYHRLLKKVCGALKVWEADTQRCLMLYSLLQKT